MQSVIWGPVTWASPGPWLEMQILRSHPNALRLCILPRSRRHTCTSNARSTVLGFAHSSFSNPGPRSGESELPGWHKSREMGGEGIRCPPFPEWRWLETSACPQLTLKRSPSPWRASTDPPKPFHWAWATTASFARGWWSTLGPAQALLCS